MTHTQTAPMVSIVVPVYNVTSYIGACLESIYNQSYPNIEVVLVDDASPDDSMQVALPYLNRLRTRYAVKIVVHPINRGLSAARNSGIDAADGEWIYLLDSDDEITPECISLLVVHAMRHPNVDFVIGGIRRIGDNRRIDKVTTPSYLHGAESIRDSYFLGQWYCMAVNKLIRSSLLLKSGLRFEEGLLHEDELFSFQLSLFSQVMGAVHEPTYIYKVRKSGTITSDMGLRNLENLLSINVRRIDTICTMINPPESYAAFYTYAIANAYSYLQLVYQNRRISKTDRLRLSVSLLEALHKVYGYRTSVSRSIRLKRVIMDLPEGIKRRVIRLNAWITRLRFG